ncbi:MAG: hypothetical protein OXF24_00160, partial [Hyphomicrobiales bacterium]|nr:hypothetical protein [Hyphomicrobiales bacterium]
MGRYAFIMMLFLLAGCGFQPVHGSSGVMQKSWLESLRGAKVEVPQTAIGWQVGRFIRERQGEGASTHHRLVITLEQVREDLLVQRDSNVIRSSVRLTGGYQFLNSDNIITSGSALVSAAYNRQRNGFVNEIALRNAEERAARELAGRIWRELTLAA